MKLPYDGMRCGNNGQFAYGTDLDAALAQIERLRVALRYWLPDETMIPAGHEIAWNEHVELIPEHRRSEPQEPEHG